MKDLQKFYRHYTIEDGGGQMSGEFYDAPIEFLCGKNWLRGADNGLYRELQHSQTSGGRSGDMSVEILTYSVFNCGREAGWTTGSVSLYVVSDNNTSGGSTCVTILFNLDGESEKARELISLLELAGYASSYASFRERPLEKNRSFKSYLDEVPGSFGEFRKI